MSATQQPGKSGISNRLLTILKTVWPGALVFLAYDLAVDPEVSILRGNAPENLKIVQIEKVSRGLPRLADGPSADSVSDHIMFGVEAVAEELALAGGSAGALVDGGWAGHFASLLEGDTEANCWSPYEVNLRLQQDGQRVHGPGSYVVDPSPCSTHNDTYVAFFSAEGERTGDNVVLEITNDETGELAMLFSGIVTGNRIVGGFSLPNGAPASGTTILTLADTGQMPLSESDL